MLFQVLCGFEPIFYTTHPNEEPSNIRVDLNGWPAAAGVIAVCITGIAICGIKEFSNFQQAKIMHA